MGRTPTVRDSALTYTLNNILHRIRPVSRGSTQLYLFGNVYTPAQGFYI